MDFDKSKILTVVTADQAKVGQKGWFDNTLAGLKKKVVNSQPQRLIGVQSDVTCSAVFIGEPGLALGLFYPAPEPTYRPYNNDELNDLVGKIVVRKCDGNKMLVIERINPMKVGLGNGWAYTAEQLLELFTLNGKPCGIKEEV